MCATSGDESMNILLFFHFLGKQDLNINIAYNETDVDLVSVF